MKDGQEKDDDELLKVSSAEEELARLKVETMRYMVTSVKLGGQKVGATLSFIGRPSKPGP